MTNAPEPVSGVPPLQNDKPPSAGLTLEALASAKHLPVEFIQSLGCRNVTRNHLPAVGIPYPDKEGNTAAMRYRLSLNTEPRFIWRKGDHVMLYGLARLGQVKEAGWVLLVEGESDAWTAWHYGLPALGIPGKSTWKPEWAKYVEGVTIYLWVEPGADDLIDRIAKDVPGLRVIYAPKEPGYSVKDISAAHIEGKGVKALVEHLRLTSCLADDVLKQKQRDIPLTDLRKRAAPLLEATDPLEHVEAAIRHMGYGGEIWPVLLVYLAATSRLLIMRVGSMLAHVLLLGPASAGKSYVLKTVLRLLPQDAYHVIDAGSPRVLIYDGADLRHKVVVFGEADSLPAGEDNPAASAMRNLLQDGYLHYNVVVRDPETGEFTVKTVSKVGPSVLVTTAVRRLGEQLDSRLFDVEVPDDQKQLQAALDAQGRLEIEGGKDPPDALVAYQALLQTMAPFDVLVPYAGKLASLISQSPAAPRLLRDYARVISLIKAVTIMRHQHREVNENGRILAAIDDYRTVYGLLKDVYAGSVTGGASEKVRSVVDAVKAIREDLAKKRAGNTQITVTMVANHLGINKMAASRRLSSAEKGGWVVNNIADRELRKTKKDFDLGEPLPPEAGLPKPEELADPSSAAEGQDECNGVTPQTERNTQHTASAHSPGVATGTTNNNEHSPSVKGVTPLQGDQHCDLQDDGLVSKLVTDSSGINGEGSAKAAEAGKPVQRESNWVAGDETTIESASRGQATEGGEHLAFQGAPDIGLINCPVKGRWCADCPTPCIGAVPRQ